MASTPTLQSFVPASFPKIADPAALQKYLRAQLAAIQKALASLNQLVQPSTVTFANAPSGPFVGQTQPFSDSNTVTWGATIAGGGAHKVLGWWNGSAWTVIGI